MPRFRMTLSIIGTTSSAVVRFGLLHPDRLVDKRSSTTRGGRFVTRVTANQVTKIDEHNHYVYDYFRCQIIFARLTR